MSEKQLKGINFPGLNNTYIIPQTDNTLSISGASADAKAAGDAIAALIERVSALEKKVEALETQNVT